MPIHSAAPPGMHKSFESGPTSSSIFTASPSFFCIWHFSFSHLSPPTTSSNIACPRFLHAGRISSSIRAFPTTADCSSYPSTSAAFVLHNSTSPASSVNQAITPGKSSNGMPPAASDSWMIAPTTAPVSSFFGLTSAMIGNAPPDSVINGTAIP